MPTTKQSATTTEAKFTTSQTTLVTKPEESSPTSVGNSEYTTKLASTQKTSTQVFNDREFTSQQPLSPSFKLLNNFGLVSMLQKLCVMC